MHIGPEVSVKLVLRVNGEVLMLERPSGRYLFPGGHTEWGEPSIECLKRELQEELSYDLVQNPEFFDLYEYITKDRSRHMIILHYLLCLEKLPSLVLSDDEADSKVHWLTRDQLTEVVPRHEFIEKVFR